MRGAGAPLAWAVLLASVFHLALPSDARPVVLPKLGPCSAKVKATYFFSNLTGMTQRTKSLPTDTVLLYMSANITVSDTFVFGPEFACTIFKADPSLNGAMPFFIYPSNDKTTVRIDRTNNIIFIGIGFYQEWTYEWMPRGTWGNPRWWVPSWWGSTDGYWDGAWTDPGLLVYRSFNIQISKCTVWGRLDIIKSALTEVTYSYIYSDSDFWQGVNQTRQDMGYGWSWCAVRVMLSGDQVNLVRANNKIAHNYIRGSSTSVLVYWGAVGTIVQNNYITGFSFGGLQCGQGMRNVADCMLNTFELNFIEPDPDIDVDGDGSGIYYDLHWVNPGNRDSCNYQLNNGRCYYLDYTTSGLLVEGGVCVFTDGMYGNNSGGGNGIKLNTGKFNTVRSLVLVANGKSFRLGWLSCQNWCYNRCAGNSEGQAWWNGYIKYYDNPMWRTNYPYMATLCTATSYTNKGQTYACNPNISTITVPAGSTGLPDCWQNMTQSNPAKGTWYTPGPEDSGNCSGLPVLNSYNDIVFVSNFTYTKVTGYYYNIWQFYVESTCAPFGDFASKVNNIPSFTTKWLPGTLGFNDESNFDYGADDPSSNIYQYYPNFFSCPKRLAGPQSASFQKARSNNAIYKKFNKYRPSWVNRAVPKAYHKNWDMRKWASKFKKAKKFVKK